MKKKLLKLGKLVAVATLCVSTLVGCGAQKKEMAGKISLAGSTSMEKLKCRLEKKKMPHI